MIPCAREQKGKQSVAVMEGLSDDVCCRECLSAMSAMDGSEDPMTFSAVLTTLCRAFSGSQGP